MIEILTLGEILVEIMREKRGVSLNVEGTFRGPYPSGAPAIFIDMVANLGHTCAIIGGVGEDEFGENCLTRLKRDNVDVSGVKISKGISTAVAFVAYNEDGSRKFIYHLRDSAATSIGSLREEDLRDVKVMHVMGCSMMIDKRIADQIIWYATKVKGFGGKISFDPNVRAELMTEEYIKDSVDRITETADIILPGVKELELITGLKDIDDGVHSLFSKNADVVVLKEGARGCQIYSKHIKSPIFVSSFKIDEVDPTGAGDSFDAGFVCGMIENRDLRDCGILANACGALNATRFGPMEGVFKREAVDEFISKNL
jgi:sugar/nucleoside kinase (ribokinase family)